MTASITTALAQGTITWGNTTTTALRFFGGPFDGERIFPGSGFVVGLYLGPAQATDPWAMQLVQTRTFASQATTATSPLAGIFLNRTFTTAPNYWAGETVTYMLRVWPAPYGTFEEFMFSGGWPPVAGVSGIGRGTLGGGASPSFAASLSLTGIQPGAVGNGPVAPFPVYWMPEPGSASLLGLGLACLLACRRRAGCEGRGREPA